MSRYNNYVDYHFNRDSKYSVKNTEAILLASSITVGKYSAGNLNVIRKYLEQITDKNEKEQWIERFRIVYSDIIGTEKTNDILSAVEKPRKPRIYKNPTGICKCGAVYTSGTKVIHYKTDEHKAWLKHRAYNN